MNAESHARIDAFLSAAATELFSSHGSSVRPAHGTASALEDPFVSTIGFTAKSIRGVLVLSVERGLAHKSMPPSLAGGDQKPEILADWTGELSNQMLGRLKNKLITVGVEIALSTPMVFFGRDLRHVSHKLPLSRSMGFEGDGRLFLEFQADFDQGFEIGEPTGVEEERPPEGEILFF